MAHIGSARRCCFSSHPRGDKAWYTESLAIHLARKQIRIYHDGADPGHTNARTHAKNCMTTTTRRMGHALGGVVRRAEIHAVHRLVLGRARRARRGRGRVAALAAAAGAAHQHLGGRRELDVGGRLARAGHALDNDG